MSRGPLSSPNSIKDNYSWSSSGGMFCERSGSLVCSFQIDVVIVPVIIHSLPPLFVPDDLLNSHIENLLKNYDVCQQSAHRGVPEIKIPVILIWGHLLHVWTGEIRKCVVLRAEDSVSIVTWQ